MGTYTHALESLFSDQRVLIFGLGRQGGGVQTANIAIKYGAQVRASDQLTASDLQSSIAQLDPAVDGHWSGHREEDIEWADLIIKNPGVPFSHPHMLAAEAAGKRVTTETSLALQMTRDRAIGITGTRGKTTTTTLIHHLLQSAHIPAVLGGNIPNFPTIALLDSIEDPETWLVLEISSFHVEATFRDHVSPHHAILTNVYPDHLNRYDSLEHYAMTKAQLFSWQHQGDHAYWNALPDRGTDHVPAFIQSEVTTHQMSEEDLTRVASLATPLLGEHNQENLALAMIVAQQVGVDETALQRGVATFQGVANRLETIATKKGIRWINDTTSTTPVALEKALDAVKPPLVLIAGGTTKNLPFSEELHRKLDTIPDAVIWLPGSGTQQLLEQFYRDNLPHNHTQVDSLEAAVVLAEELARTHRAESVLFSPGFTSFELFANEFQRGEVFRSLVMNRV